MEVFRAVVCFATILICDPNTTDTLLLCVADTCSAYVPTVCLGLQKWQQIKRIIPPMRTTRDLDGAALFPPAFQPDPERQEESRDASIPRRGSERARDGGMKLEKGNNILSEEK